ncbi:hypothetical protein LWP59_26080 [Amycolatopsis acidiphila]|uniref:Transmembrane protein n=1 Tax=Amycolatopsis acidiphila TaxID=715473 RepID=A0A558ADS6_9PSEU|nr:hypothetical protein [Amycolatopsis acidiphila]TVT22405.1 hypothetical protein FNH06_13500 [Amycolatopsis acidiphila]UIJ57604.1 hypothetical protein LWP59_26080 [Amycolatopsis acidiphila]GHG89754.1 hypothetical protein GCM10017788_64740 [Amycolatopsis acidiphila]
MNEPTPEEAAAALRAVHKGKEQVINSAMGSRWMWIISGLIVFLYCAATDLFPRQAWLGWPAVVCCLVLALGLRTRVGGTLLGRSVVVSSRSLSVTLKWRLLRIAPILAIGIAVASVITLFHVPHGEIYYGALAGLYIMFLGPRFQLWLLRRQDKD